MSLFTFHNAFDDITVGLEDDSPLVDGQMTQRGPFTVSVKHGDEAVGGDDTAEQFMLLSEAKTKFLELVSSEIDSVLMQTEEEIAAAKG